LSRAEGRRFGLTVGLAFLALSLLLWWREHQVAGAVTSGAAAFFIAGGLLLPERLGPVQSAWLRMGLAISKVTTPIMLGIIFFIVITPFGLVARAVGHRPLERARTGTLWRSRDGDDRKSDLSRQF
jgi:hypothetical protein